MEYQQFDKASKIELKIFKRLRSSSPYVYYTLQNLYIRFAVASVYAFFGQYLNVDAHQLQSLDNLIRNVSSLKNLFSFISDSVPICGLRRLPYVLIGLFMILACSTIMFFRPIPEPYFESYNEVDEDGNSNCSRDLNVIRNPEAHNRALDYATLFMVAFIGLAFSDCCMDAFTAQRTSLEEETNRGSILLKISVVKRFSAAVFASIFAILYNQIDYGGHFCPFGVKLNQLALIVAIGCIIAIVYVTMFTNERDYESNQNVKLRENLLLFWNFLQTPHFLMLVGNRIILAHLFGFRTPAKSKVEIRWLKVEPLTKGMQEALLNILKAVGSWIYMKYFINFNWRKTVVILILIDLGLKALFQPLAVLGVIRSQYFWNADDEVTGIFAPWFTLIYTFVVVEYTPRNLEGTTVAFLWSVAPCIGSVALTFFEQTRCLMIAGGSGC
ncbi:uncharacterized protein LOC134841284 isoform X2 [Symsagittifera roscoffensis]|uniref:uncharacterized protein LOC134841284 isoform X2 n=1 Tax=Symsagittifera roscoffensis TaxID=84072 RepID=UPI00307B5208